MSSRPTGRPIALYLLVLALVALVPAFLFSAVLLQRNNEAQQRVVSSLTTATTQAIANAVDRQVSGLQTTLRVLSTAPSLLAGDLVSFHQRAMNALAGTRAYIIVLDEQFQQVINTRVVYGMPLGPTSNPKSAQEALDTGRTVVSDVFFGRTAKTWVFNIVMPLKDVRQGPARLLILTQDAMSLAPALTSRELPPEWSVALLDRQGHVISASPDAGLAPGDVLPLAIDRSPAAQGRWQTAEREGEKETAVLWNVGSTGWQVVAWAPETAVQRPYLETFWSLLGGGILLAALVIGVIYWVSLQIGRSVRGLENDAKLLGSGEAVPARAFPISEIATVSGAIADASRRRKAAETEVRLLMRELAHRSKNQITVIAAMAKQSAKGVDSVPEFVASFERRIHSLARSTDLLLARGIAGVGLADVLRQQIDPLCPLEGGRVALSGPALTLNTQAAQILGMAAHEMAANAVRHGAFATDRGRIDVSWTVAGEQLRLVWRERLAALRERPQRRGFGTTVIETMVGRSLGATVNRTLHQDGIEWEFVIPAAALDLHADADEAFGEGAGKVPPAAGEK
ncbi:MAG TPA: histidine kinase [Alphaproteobacteria bacterium]|nr:histidine kinase [Alphaproteobacteria bacterium]